MQITEEREENRSKDNSVSYLNNMPNITFPGYFSLEGRSGNLEKLYKNFIKII